MSGSDVRNCVKLRNSLVLFLLLDWISVNGVWRIHTQLINVKGRPVADQPPPTLMCDGDSWHLGI